MAAVYALAALTVALDVSAAVRVLVVPVALLGATGWVLAARLGARSTIERAVLGVAGAAAVAMLVSQALLYAGAWSPIALLVVVGASSVTGAVGLRIGGHDCR